MAYNPGITYQGGEYIARGISQFGDAVKDGLRQYIQNKEQDEFLTQQAESLAPDLKKYAAYGELANESGPGGQMFKSLSNFANLSLAKKKAAVMDAKQFISQKEAQQRRNEDNQYKLLTMQHQQNQDELARQQFEMTKELSKVQMDASRQTAMMQREAANRQALGNALLLRGQATPQMQAAGDFAQGAGSLDSRLGAYAPSSPRLFGTLSPTGAVDAPPPLHPYIEAMARAGAIAPSELPQLLHYGGQVNKPDFMPRLLNVGDGFSAMTTSTGSAMLLPKPAAAKPDLVNVTTKIGDNTFTSKVPREEAERMMNRARPVGDAKLSGQLAQLEAMKARGVKTAKLDGDGAAENPWMGGIPIDDLIARLRAQSGGGPAAPSGGSRFKIEEVK